MVSQTILVVDDEIDLGELIADALRARGWYVEVASHIDEARAIWRQRRFDFILSDLNFDSDHRDTAEVFRKLIGSAHTRIILMSGAFLPLVDYRTEMKVDGILSKPFELSALFQLLNSLMPEKSTEPRRI